MYFRYVISPNDNPEECLCQSWEDGSYFWHPLEQFCEGKMLVFKSFEWCEEYIAEHKLPLCTPNLKARLHEHSCPKCGDELVADGPYFTCRNCFCDATWDLKINNGIVMGYHPVEKG